MLSSACAVSPWPADRERERGSALDVDVENAPVRRERRAGELIIREGVASEREDGALVIDPEQPLIVRAVGACEREAVRAGRVLSGMQDPSGRRPRGAPGRRSRWTARCGWQRAASACHTTAADRADRRCDIHACRLTRCGNIFPALPLSPDGERPLRRWGSGICFPCRQTRRLWVFVQTYPCTIIARQSAFFL